MELELKVEGMKCNDCSSRVVEALKVRYSDVVHLWALCYCLSKSFC